jgi:hypothetical protein
VHSYVEQLLPWDLVEAGLGLEVTGAAGGGAGRRAQLQAWAARYPTLDALAPYSDSPVLHLQVTDSMRDLCTHLHVFKSWSAVGVEKGNY